MTVNNRALWGVVTLFLIGFFWVATATPLRAESPGKSGETKPLDWLQRQPLTLFDWGLFNLRRDLDRVATWIADSGLSDDKPLVGAQHNWRTGRISAYLSFAAPPKKRTRKYCHMVFLRAVAQVMRGAPQGVGQASWYLSSVFLPPGQSWMRPTRDFGAKLVKVIQLEIVLRPEPTEFRPGGPRVRCAGRFDASEKELVDEVTN